MCIFLAMVWSVALAIANGAVTARFDRALVRRQRPLWLAEEAFRLAICAGWVAAFVLHAIFGVCG